MNDILLQEEYVTFEQSKLLKEKGFPQDIEDKIELKGFELGIPMYEKESQEYFEFAQPTLSLVQKWLREEKLIHIVPECEPNVDSYGNTLGYYYELKMIVFDFHDEESTTTYAESFFKTYEEALSAGIDSALELI